MAELNLNKKTKTFAGGVSINGTSSVTGIYQETISAGNPVIVVEEPAAVTTNWDTSVTHIQPDLAASYQPDDCAWSSDDTYLALARNSAIGFEVYKRSGDAFSKITTPSLGGAGLGIDFSSDDTYLAVSLTDSPYLKIYKRSGDTFTLLSGPNSVPTNDGECVAFSRDTTYLALGHAATGYLMIYKRSGDTFTKLTNPTTTPTGEPTDVRFSPNGDYLTVTHNTSPFVSIYKRSGDTFTKLANPSNLPTQLCNEVSWSPDSTYMAIVHDSSPYMTIFSRSGDTFTKVENPSTLPDGNGDGISFSIDGLYLAIIHTTTSRGKIYKRSGDTFTYQSSLSDSTATPTSVKFSKSGVYLALTSFNTPYIDVFKTTINSISAFNKIYLTTNDLAEISADTTNLNAIGYATEAGVLDDEKSITAIWKEV